MTMPEIVQMPLPLCDCGQLRKTPVDNSPGSRAGDSTLLSKDKSLDDPELWTNLAAGVELLCARVEAIEYELGALISILDRPLSPAQCIAELRRLRDEI